MGFGKESKNRYGQAVAQEDQAQRIYSLCVDKFGTQRHAAEDEGAGYDKEISFYNIFVFHEVSFLLVSVSKVSAS